MQFICPHCKILLEANIALAGQICRCKNCGGDVLVPTPAPTAGTHSDGNVNKTSSSFNDIEPRRILKLENIIKRYDEKIPNINQAFLLLLGYLGLILFIGIPIKLICAFINPELAEHPLFNAIISFIIILVLAKFVSYKIGITLSDLLPIGEPELILIATAFTATLGINLLVTAFTFTLIKILPALDEVFKSFPLHLEEQFKLSSWSTLLKVVVIIPIVEETLFRGIILRGFLKNYNTNKAVIVSAIIFGIIHLNPIRVVSAAFAGIFLGFIYAKTRTLSSSIALHSINNLWPSLFAIPYSFGLTGNEEPTYTDIYWAFIISLFSIGLILTISGLYFFIKRYRQPA